MATDRNDALLGQILGQLGVIGDRLSDICDRLPTPVAAGGEPDPEPESETPMLLTEPATTGDTEPEQGPEPDALAEPARRPAKKAAAPKRRAPAKKKES